MAFQIDSSLTFWQANWIELYWALELISHVQMERKHASSVPIMQVKILLWLTEYILVIFV